MLLCVMVFVEQSRAAGVLFTIDTVDSNPACCCHDIIAAALTDSASSSAIAGASRFPADVRKRVNDTFGCFGLSIAATAASAAVFFRSGLAARYMTLSTLPMILLSLGASTCVTVRCVHV